VRYYDSPRRRGPQRVPTRPNGVRRLEPIGEILKRTLPQIMGLALALRALVPCLRPGLPADRTGPSGGRWRPSKSFPWRESDRIQSGTRRFR